jgi:hypothetical protein
MTDFRVENGINSTIGDLRYLKLVQPSPPQHVSADSPNFDEGLVIKTGKKLYFDGQGV